MFTEPSPSTATCHARCRAKGAAAADRAKFLSCQRVEQVLVTDSEAVVKRVRAQGTISDSDARQRSHLAVLRHGFRADEFALLHVSDRLNLADLLTKHCPVGNPKMEEMRVLMQGGGLRMKEAENAATAGGPRKKAQEPKGELWRRRYGWEKAYE